MNFSLELELKRLVTHFSSNNTPVGLINTQVNLIVLRLAENGYHSTVSSKGSIVTDTSNTNNVYI